MDSAELEPAALIASATHNQPQIQTGGLVKLLTDMKEGLDDLRYKFQPFVTKVKEGQYPTRDGITYLEVKHLLLLSYCEHLVFMILLKAEGKSLPDHPVIQQLAEIRLFLEKIRPIDKKLQYQIDKLLKQATAPSTDQFLSAEKDDLKYKPNPDLLVSKVDEDAQEFGGVYKPPKIAPTAMEDDAENAKDKRSRLRSEREAQRRASRSSFIKDLANDIEGRPEEVQDFIGAESKEFQREIERLDNRAKQEEELFARIPLRRVEKKRLKHLKRSSRNGLQGMMDDFKDDVGGLIGMEDDNSRQSGEKSARPRKLKSSKGKSALRVKKSKGKFKKKGKR